MQCRISKKRVKGQAWKTHINQINLIKYNYTIDIFQKSMVHNLFQSCFVHFDMDYVLAGYSFDIKKYISYN